MAKPVPDGYTAPLRIGCRRRGPPLVLEAGGMSGLGHEGLAKGFRRARGQKSIYLSLPQRRMGEQSAHGQRVPGVKG